MAIPGFNSLSSSSGANDLTKPNSLHLARKLNGPPDFPLQPQFVDTTNSENSDRVALEGAKRSPENPPQDEDLRKAFQDFVGQTLFSQMIASMRTTQEGSAYFNGGRAEKIFQGQLDQMLSEELSDASASQISDPMFKLFQLRRQ